MARILLLLLAAYAACAADDPWAKVKDLNTGAEIRVYKRGSTQPVAARFADLTDTNLVVILKNTQSAIPKDQIDRLDYRPEKPNRVTRQTTVKREAGDPDSPVPELRKPTDSYSSSLMIGSKPDFETIYRRPAAKPKEQVEQKPEK